MLWVCSSFRPSMNFLLQVVTATRGADNSDYPGIKAFYNPHYPQEGPVGPKLSQILDCQMSMMAGPFVWVCMKSILVHYIPQCSQAAEDSQEVLGRKPQAMSLAPVGLAP